MYSWLTCGRLIRCRRGVSCEQHGVDEGQLLDHLRVVRQCCREQELLRVVLWREKTAVVSSMTDCDGDET
jgi:hypothetical protein